MKFNTLDLLIIFIASAIVASIGDTAHILSLTASYHRYNSILVYVIPFWVPIQFGIAGVALFLFRTFFIPQKTFPTLKQSTISSLFFIVIYILSGFIPSHLGYIKFAILLALALIQIKLTAQKNYSLFFYAIPVILTGVLYEWNLGRLDIFVYNNVETQIAGIPIWLPVLYLSAFGSLLYFPTPSLNKK